MNKRGISEVVSYTLLIVIALTMSVIVYAFLKSYVPRDKPECQEGISIIIENLNCTHETSPNANNLSLTLQNTGRFKIDFAYIRVGNASRKIKVDAPPINPLPLYNKSNNKGLDPQESTTQLNFKLPSSYSNTGDYILEVQPTHYTKGTDIESLALCAPITQPLKCA